jgi:hypothetical protein
MRGPNQELRVELIRFQFAKFFGPHDRVIVTIDGKTETISPR